MPPRPHCPMFRCPPSPRSPLAVAILSLGLGLPAAAQADDTPRVLDVVNVVGAAQGADSTPGSATYLGVEDIREQSYDDINAVLRRVPGVYIRGEDGYGLFPNISLRGVDTGRSAKVTLMEDGVPIAPAPYASPSAYYSPTAGRMAGIEVLKGSSQVRYGPQTTGGVINYLSTPIPLAGRAYLKTLYGSQNEFRAHGFVGDTLETEAGRFGYLLEGFFRRTDGFKTIDSTPDFRDGSNTGFHNVDPMIKLSFEPDTAMYQRLELKFGYTNLEADETYLGLNDADFRADPNRRYSATRFDNIDTEHYRSYARYFVSPSEQLDLVTTVYYNRFDRNWYKLQSIGGGVTPTGLAQALATPGSSGLACLKGQAACDLTLRANNRTYYSLGVEQQAVLRFALGATDHELTAGLRYHYDEEDRFQLEDTYSQAANGTISGVSFGAPGSQANRVDSANALALFVQDRISFGRWQFMPGIRFESLELERKNRATGTSSDTSETMVGGGLGVTYAVDGNWKLFGGIHRGFAPPPPGGAINDGLGEETSLAYELGARYLSNDGALSAEAVGFLTDFDNLIVTPNLAAAGSGNPENVGEVRTLGLEFSASFDAGIRNGWMFSNPWFVAFTYTDAEMRSDTPTDDPDSIFSFGRKGNQVPYVPTYQFTAGSALHFERWGGELRASYVDSTFTSASNVSTPVNGAGQPDARFGTTDAYWVVDLSAYYQLREGVRAMTGVHNLLDEEYLASRQPYGARPGQPRFAYVALEFDFDI